jgi:hypothetical protein
LIEFGSPWYVLRDTRDDNITTIARATANTGVAKTLSQAWTGRDGSAALDRIARLHLAAGRYTVVRALVQTLTARNREIGDLLRGDLAAREGDWEAATTIWTSLNTLAAWLRIADWDFQNGRFQDAAKLYARVEDRNRGPKATLNYGFTLIALKRDGDAISILSQLKPGAHSVPGLLAPLLRSYARDRQGQNRMGDTERSAFAKALDDLRGRLEEEQGQDILDALLAWMNRQRAAFPAELRRELEETLYRRITGPMPNYYRGVRLYWLGAYGDASYAFENYLKALPENSAESRALALFERAQQLTKTK